MCQQPPTGRTQCVSVFNSLTDVKLLPKAHVSVPPSSSLHFGVQRHAHKGIWDSESKYRGKLTPLCVRCHLQVFIAALIGGFSLGQAAPVLEVFAKGKSAGARLMKVIRRKPAIDLDDVTGRELEKVRK